jgi:hypothetical protein
MHLLAQLLGADDPNDLDTGRIGQLDVGGDDRDAGTAGDRRLGERVTLAPRRTVAQEADGIEVFASSTGGHHDVGAGEVLRASLEHLHSRGVDLRGRWQPALARVHAGQAANRGFEDHVSARTQGLHVGTRGVVLPHLGVHGRGEDHRAVGREQRVGQEVVRETVRGLRQDVGGGRGHQNEVGALPDADVRDLVDVLEDAGLHRLAAQRLPRGGADEVQRRRGRDDPDAVTGLGEQAQQLRGLVGRDATGHTEHDLCHTYRLALEGLTRM